MAAAAADLFLSASSSAIEAASALPAAGFPHRSAKFRLPATSPVTLSSRSVGKLFSVGDCSKRRVPGVRVVHAAMVSSTVDLNARPPEVKTAIDEAMHNCITETHLNDTIPSLGPKIRGKVGKSIPSSRKKNKKQFPSFPSVMISRFHGVVAGARHLWSRRLHGASDYWQTKRIRPRSCFCTFQGPGGAPLP